jgi:hypothetical protein
LISFFFYLFNPSFHFISFVFPPKVVRISLISIEDYQTDKYLFYLLNYSEYTGGANTNQYVRSIGLDKANGDIIKLSDFFKNDLKLLNVIEPNKWIKATDTIDDQINLIKILEEKGYTYIISDGVYFDTSKLEKYGRLWGGKRKK